MKKPHSTRRRAPQPASRPVIGIALGSGSARGWGHIGTLRALIRLGIEPHVVAGASIGALIGAAYVSGNLDALTDWALSLRRSGFLRFLDLRVPGGGLVQGGRLMETLGQFIPDVPIESLPKPFAAVATDLGSGREVWFREGPLLQAVRASIAVPGLFTPWQSDHSWLVDGGLANPVPVTLCRALGAELVIGVNPFGDRLYRIPSAAISRMEDPEPAEDEDPIDASWEVGALRERANRLLTQLLLRNGQRNGAKNGHGGKSPRLLDVLVQSLNIMQDRIIRSRLAGDPPDLLLSPKLSHIGLLEFDRAEEAIAEGNATVERALPSLRQSLGFPEEAAQEPERKG